MVCLTLRKMAENLKSKADVAKLQMLSCVNCYITPLLTDRRNDACFVNTWFDVLKYRQIYSPPGIYSVDPLPLPAVKALYFESTHTTRESFRMGVFFIDMTSHEMEISTSDSITPLEGGKKNSTTLMISIESTRLLKLSSCVSAPHHGNRLVCFA